MPESKGFWLYDRWIAPVIMHEQEKWCMGCQAMHPVSAFGPSRAMSDGLQHSCRTIRAAQGRATRERHRNGHGVRGKS